jgi:hypothetical protein
MQFHVEFSYPAANREKLMRFLHETGLNSEGSLKVVGAWVSVQTGAGYAVLDAKDAIALYELCSTWSDFGTVKLTPVIGANEI